jgi:polysaccharide biosynthesis transport protein
MQIARRRWWVVTLLMLVAGGAAYLSSSRETPRYSASATMLVTPGQSYAGAIDYNTLLVMERLTQSYAQLVSSGGMYERVSAELGVGVEEIPATVSASTAEGSQLIFVTVTDTDPERAAQVANAFAEEFEGYVEEQAQGRAESAGSGLDSQIAALQQRQAEIDERLAELPALDDVEDPIVEREIADLQQERAAITDSLIRLNTESVTIGAQILAASPGVAPAGEAVPPTEPFEPQPRRAAMLGAFVGLLLGVGLVALLEFLDNTVKPEQNFPDLVGAPLLATVSLVNKLQPGSGQVFTLSQPRSSASEAVRLLRTNLEFIAASGDIRALTVTSPGPGEGKSTMVANLGVALAQAGQQVAIIDADLRRPTQHHIFGVSNEAGLTTLLTHPDREWDATSLKVALPGLQLIPSGPLPPNPADLLSSHRFEAMLDAVRSEVDVVLIDSPPVLAASDALAVATHTDGVVMVCRSHKTRVDHVRQASHLIQQGGIRLVGLVLNQQKGQQGASYYGKYYGPAAATGD